MPASGEGPPLVGRDAALATLAELVVAHPLVTVSGPPGVGKSALVSAWARARRGCLLVDASGCTSWEALSDRLSVALRRPVGALHARALAALLHGVGADVLVLDGMDALVADAREPILPWLRAGGVPIVVTSRRRLGIPVEAVFELPPLSVVDLHGREPPAVELLRARLSRRVGPARAAEMDAHALQELVAVLDGIPLAIELVTPRIVRRGVATVLAELGGPVDLLSPATGTETLPSIRQAIDASWDTLPAWARHALTTLTVFHDGFGIEAAEAVVRLDGFADAVSVLDAIAFLLDGSLLTSASDDTGVRYRLLGLLAEHAREAGDPSELARAEERHHLHYATRAAGHTSSSGPEGDRVAVEALRAERANYAAALAGFAERPATAGSSRRDTEHAATLALALSRLWRLDGATSRELALLERVRARPDYGSLAASLRGRLLLARGLSYRLAGVAEPHAELLEAVSLAEEAKDAELLARACERLSLVEVQRGRVAAARGHARRAVTLLRASGDRAGLARVLQTCAYAELAAGDARAALDELAESAALSEDLGDPYGAGTTAGFQGECLHALGMLEEAEAAYQRAHDAHAAAHNARWAAGVLALRAAVHVERGDLDGAARLLEDAGTRASALSDVRLDCAVLAGTSLLHEARGDAPSALRAVTAALALVDATSRSALRASLLLRACRFALATGDAAAAERYAREAASLAPEQHGFAELLDLVRRMLRDPEYGSLERAVDAIGAGSRGPVQGVELRFALAAARRTRSQASDGRVTLALPDKAGGPWPQGKPLPAACTRVAEDARWVLRGGGGRIDLSRKKALWRLVEQLVTARLDEPGRVVTTYELHEHGWPGEAIHPTGGPQRVYTALWQLKKLGLEDWARRRDDGYCLVEGEALARGPAADLGDD